MKKTLSNKGFTKVILIAIVIIGALAYYNIDLRAVMDKIFNSPFFQSGWTFAKEVWFNYLAPIWTFIKTHVGALFS